MPILCVGSVAFDSIETPFGKINKTLGGSASYFSLASSLFMPTAIIAVVGSDFNSFDVFKKRNIDISGLKKQSGKTFHWAGKYRFDLNTRDTLKTSLGVFAGFKPKLDELHKQAKYIFLGNIHPKLQLDVLRQTKKPKLVGLDTMNFWIKKTPRDLLAVMKKISLLVINEGEARELSKEYNLLKAARKILAMMHEPYIFRRPHQNVKSVISSSPLQQRVLVVKQGEHGLLLFHRNSIFNLPGYPLENVVDPTGAGDSFAGALMGFLAKTNDSSIGNLKKACAIASAVASFCVEDFGVKKLQALTLSQVNKRLTEYKSLINF